jgi:hypothetical protein
MLDHPRIALAGVYVLQERMDGLQGPAIAPVCSSLVGVSFHLARVFSEPVSFALTRSLVDFITIMSESRFSVHTGRMIARHTHRIIDAHQVCFAPNPIGGRPG